MKKMGILLLVLFSQRSFSQSSFTKFVENSSIEWAADASDTFRFNHPNLSLLLRERLNKGTIKGSIGEFDADFEKRKIATKENILDRIAPNRIVNIMDADGNITRTVIEAESPLLSSQYFDEITQNLIEVKQVLYIQSGRLQSYTPWVTTKFSVYTSNGNFIGVANGFSTGFHTSRNKVALLKKAMPLGTTKTMIRLDTALPQKMLKQLYGRNMLQTIWPQFSKKTYQIYRVDSNQLIPFSAINNGLVNDEILHIPVSDSLGNISSRTITQNSFPLELSSITAIELEQEWYYHSKKNQVFNHITTLILYARKWKNGHQEAVASPLLKIILP
jgi:hypothetical protein